jgi:hypothetical protein
MSATTGHEIGDQDQDEIGNEIETADMAVPTRKLETRLGLLVSVRIKPRF